MNKFKSFLVHIISILTKFYIRLLYGKNNNLILKSLLYFTSFRIKGTGNKLKFEKNSILRNFKIKIIGNNNSIIISNNVKVYIRMNIFIYGNNSKIYIGENTKVLGCEFLLGNNSFIEVGEDSLFSDDIKFFSSDGHTIIEKDTSTILNPGKDIILGKHVWIGYGCTILKGSIIGDNSILGTRSVLTGKAIPPNSIWAGNPARHIKNNIDWDINAI